MFTSMNGWTGTILYIDLGKGKSTVDRYPGELAYGFIGGRGFAVKLLWDLLKPGTSPLSPENLLILAAGPLTGLPVPSSGKLVIASKSPLTGGYGDGSIGTHAAVQMRRAGYDAIVLKGRAENRSILVVEDDRVELVDAEDYWGLSTSEVERRVKEDYGGDVAVVSIGPAGENLVKYANVVSQGGRAGGRPGMGAVMGSKNLKALVFRGSSEIPVADKQALKREASEAYRRITELPNYGFWRRQGTMATVEWSQENSVLPCMNFREGVFEEAEAIGGFAMEKIKVGQRGCPYCNATCGNLVEDSTGSVSELDYENVAMLGANIALGDLEKVATLNRMADELGLDAISLGNAIGFAFEASERHLLDEKLEWGSFEDAKTLVEDIAYRRGLGALLAEGVRYASLKLGGGSERWAMHVKGLEISGYDCHSAPGMALAYGTSPIGAHHKDAWIISWEVKTDRRSYSGEKVDKLIELQRIRGGLFEFLTLCRLPWVELGLELERYPRLLHAATGLRLGFDKLFEVADRIYCLIRAFWVREYGGWSVGLDYPPDRWFEEPTRKGPCRGSTLDREGYGSMLQLYYARRGWSPQGIPRRSTMERLGLANEAEELSRYVNIPD